MTPAVRVEYTKARIADAYAEFTEGKPELILACAYVETKHVFVKTEGHC